MRFNIFPEGVSPLEIETQDQTETTRYGILTSHPQQGIKVRDMYPTTLWALENTPGFKTSLQREHETLSQLRHPRLPHAHAYGYARTEAGFPGTVEYLVMDHIEGTSLGRISEKTLEDIVPLVSQASEVLEAVHQAGYVHADVKPHNMRVSPEGSVYIIDFDLAVPIGQVGRGFSPNYAAPEQLRREPLDARTDVYCLAAVLYETATGRIFDTRTAKEIPPKTIPESVRTAVLVGLCERESRPTMREFRELLPRYVSQVAVSARKYAA